MGDSNTAESTYTMYRHLQQCCSDPSIYGQCSEERGQFSDERVLNAFEECIDLGLRSLYRLTWTEIFCISILSQTTNFRLSQTESACRQQFQI